ncbi:MAG: hypothetical protein ABI405_04970 [Parafilimonas sp.]
MQSITVSLPHTQTLISLPFNTVEILDVRPDSTSIGFLKSGTFEKTERINFRNNLASQFHEYITMNYLLRNTDTITGLIILIKNFRVSSFMNFAGVKDDNSILWNSGIILSAELFLNNGKGYHALYKVDTLITEDSKTGWIESAIVEAFQTILQKVANKNLSQIHIGKTEFSDQDIEDHVAGFYNIPIINDSILNVGVYLNFTEFKVNNPSIKNFEIKKGKLSDELYISEGNQTYPLQDFWGYCDGKNLFIHSAKNLFQLYKAGNTFNTLAFKSLKKKTFSVGDAAMIGAANLITEGILMPPLAKNTNVYKAKSSAFQLNIQDGEIY